MKWDLNPLDHAKIYAQWPWMDPKAHKEARHAWTEYLLHVLYVFGSNTAEELMAQGGGLITQRTVTEWLWNATDPLVNVLMPSKAGANFFHNNSNEPGGWYTGKSDISLVQEQFSWMHSRFVTGVWPKPMPISGTPGGQFQPFLKGNDTIKIWGSDTHRMVEMSPQGHAPDECV